MRPYRRMLIGALIAIAVVLGVNAALSLMERSDSSGLNWITLKPK
jgi:hypothetical protein